MTEQTTPNRIFKIGTSTIVEDASFAGMNHEQIRDVLKRSYPEAAHATIRERTKGATLINMGQLRDALACFETATDLGHPIASTYANSLRQRLK